MKTPKFTDLEPWNGVPCDAATIDELIEHAVGAAFAQDFGEATTGDTIVVARRVATGGIVVRVATLRREGVVS